MPTVPSSQLVAVNNLGQNTPADPSRIGLVVGPTAAGTVNQIILDDSLATIEQNFDSGPGSEEAACAIVEPSAGTVYQIKTATSTAGTVSSVSKTPGATVGTIVDNFGSVLTAGADFNGDVLFTAKVEGAQLIIVAGGAEGIVTSGLLTTITIKTGTTTGTSEVALVTGYAPALAQWSAVAVGTGASLNSATVPTFVETSGRIGFQALTTGMQVRTIITGNNTARSVVLTGGNIVDIGLATNSHGEPAATETALAIQNAVASLASANPGLFRSTLAGSGAGLLGALNLTALPFGSTGAMTVSGNPNDAYQVSVQVNLAGGLGSAGVTVSVGNAQGLPLYGASYIIPSGGVIILPDTGLTLTFTGTFDVLDTFVFSTTAPLSTLADVVAALAYFSARPEHASLVQVAGEIPIVNLPAWVVALETLAESMSASLTLPKYLRILLEYSGPISQTNAQWATAVSAQLANLAAPRISVFGGSANAAAALPLPQPGRFEVVNGSRFVFARALALSAGIDVVDQTQSGKATGVLTAYQTDAAQALAATRSSYFFLLSGTPGIQMDFVLLDSPTGDYTRGVIGRVVDKVSFYASIFQTKYAGTRQKRNQNGTLAQTSRMAIQEDLDAKLKRVVVDTSDCQAVTSVVNGMNLDGRLIVTYYVQIFFYVYNIFGKVGVSATVPVTV